MSYTQQDVSLHFTQALSSLLLSTRNQNCLPLVFIVTIFTTSKSSFESCINWPQNLVHVRTVLSKAKDGNWISCIWSHLRHNWCFCLTVWHWIWRYRIHISYRVFFFRHATTEVQIHIESVKYIEVLWSLVLVEGAKHILKVALVACFFINETTYQLLTILLENNKHAILLGEMFAYLKGKA